MTAARLPIKDAVSAGGVVWRKGRNGIELVLCGRTAENLWGLPKGTPDPGESPEATAIREVQEETGLVVEIGAPLGAIDYWFVAAGVRYHKYVHHWLMTATGGDVSLHDHEFDEVRWFPLAEAQRTATYENERRVISLAARALGVEP